MPGVVLATVAFESAAAAQARALGFDPAVLFVPHPAVLFVPHPIQNRTPEELEAIADDAVARLLQLLSPDNHAGSEPA